LVSNVSQGKNRGIPGQVMDLSKSGARLQLDRPLGKVGDKIQLKGKFDVAGIRRILDLRGVIRSFPKSDAGLNGIQCGVEFVENHEDKLLVLYGYISYTSSYGNIQSVR